MLKQVHHHLKQGAFILLLPLSLQLSYSFETFTLIEDLLTPSSKFHLVAETDHRLSIFVEHYDSERSCLLEWDYQNKEDDDPLSTHPFITPKNADYLGVQDGFKVYYRDTKGILATIARDEMPSLYESEIIVDKKDIIHASRLQHLMLIENQTQRMAHFIDNSNVTKLYTPGPILKAVSKDVFAGINADRQNLWIRRQKQYNYVKFVQPHSSKITSEHALKLIWLGSDGNTLIYASDQSSDPNSVCYQYFAICGKTHQQIAISPENQQLFPISLDPQKITSYGESPALLLPTQIEPASPKCVVICDPKAASFEKQLKFIRLNAATKISGHSSLFGKDQPLAVAQGEDKSFQLLIPTLGWQDIKSYLQNMGEIPPSLLNLAIDNALLTYEQNSQSMILFCKAGANIYGFNFRSIIHYFISDENGDVQFTCTSPDGSKIIVKDSVMDLYTPGLQLTNTSVLLGNELFEPKDPSKAELIDITGCDNTSFICLMDVQDKPTYKIYDHLERSFRLPQLRKNCSNAKLNQIRGNIVVGSHQVGDRQVACYWKKNGTIWQSYSINSLQDPTDELVKTELMYLCQGSSLMFGNAWSTDGQKTRAFATKPLSRTVCLPTDPFGSNTAVTCVAESNLVVGGLCNAKPCIWWTFDPKPNSNWQIMLLSDSPGCVRYISPEGSLIFGSCQEKACFWRFNACPQVPVFLKDLLDSNAQKELEQIEIREIVFAYPDRQSFLVNGFKGGKKVCYKIRINQPLD
jgi:hypothetical protein